MQTELTPSDPVRQRRQAHALLDVLTAEKLTAVRSLLEVMAGPLPRSLALSPVEEERTRISQAWRRHPARRDPARVRPPLSPNG